jgi:uncharacterized protein YgbK (DUF1537 family)
MMSKMTKRQIAIIVGRAADKAIDQADRGGMSGEVEDVLERIGNRVIKAYHDASTMSVVSEDRGADQ